MLESLFSGRIPPIFDLVGVVEIADDRDLCLVEPEFRDVGLILDWLHASLF
jgi:hypothetical protein